MLKRVGNTAREALSVRSNKGLKSSPRELYAFSIGLGLPL
jgi:hypothetical protein